MANSDLVFWPDKVGEWKRAVHDIIEHMSQEEAFVSCCMHQDAADPNPLTLYERWSEPPVEAFLKNQMKPYRVAYEAKLPDLLQRPREPAVLLPLGEWHKAKS